jgi:NAD(P)-dependent dehydrogenase (short-subunit alcohol dehydrogenase family)
MGRLDGKTALVAGASGGIGGAGATMLAREGAAVVCGDVDGAAAEARAAAIRAVGGKAVATTLDVADPVSIDAAVRRTVTEFGGADILLDSAGISTTAIVLELTRAAWDRVLVVNLTGMFLLGQAVARQMVARGRGDSIVNVTSQLAEVGVHQKTAYFASKGGGRSLTIGMALDLAPYEIRVNAVAPGPTIVTRTGVNVSYGQRRLVLAQMASGIFGPCAAPFAGAKSPRRPGQSCAVSAPGTAPEPAARRRRGLSRMVRGSRMPAARAA